MSPGALFEHDPVVQVGEPLQADPWVVIGERSGRPDVDHAGSLGPHAHLRRGTILYAGSQIGAHFETGHYVIVREQCRIGDHVSIWSQTVVDYGVTIGSHVSLHTGLYISQYTTLEDEVFCAPGVKFANDPHPVCGKCMAGPTIKRGARLGVGVVVNGGVTIGEGALIGAGSVVTRDIPAGMVAVGNPARVLYHVTELECPYGLTPYDVLDGRVRDVIAQGHDRARVDGWAGPPQRPAKLLNVIAPREP
jgi:acetyltransferase-like isoleucine patch superfamily enzyme